MALVGERRHQEIRSSGASSVPLDADEAASELLHRYGILDAEPEIEFDQVAALATDLLGTPVALVAFVDAERLWFKARTGLGETEGPRSLALCGHVVDQAGGVFVVPDAAADPRFTTNPLVHGEQPFRFYAGAPLLTSEGAVLGALCVLSPEPRPAGLQETERRRLASLAAMIMRTLELRRERLRAERQAGEAEVRRSREDRLRLALEVADACAWELDPASGLSTWDPAARVLLGLPEVVAHEEALRIFVHAKDIGQVRSAVATALDPAGDGRYSVVHRSGSPGPDGRPRWFQSLGQAYFELENGVTKAVRLVCATIEVTGRRAAEERQALLMAELNHRVKNTLAVVLAIAEQTRRATDTRLETAPVREVPERRRFHADFQSRLLALARTHDLLTQEAWQGAPLAKLVAAALAPFSIKSPNVTPNIAVSGPSVQLAPEPAVTLSIALHELVANAARHGALSSPTGRISVKWQSTADGRYLELTWVEEGGPRLAGPPVHRGFGTNLLGRGLGRQLGGEVALLHPPEGLQCHMRLPVGRHLRLA
ncbi:sensor histidine kinase [Falsiroseomonas sp. HC035]|uniref:sensor histidine kinase n=1 Tax=Falsiroseomonas sp. HC035 TaxID=3390999 RepID=UPI003D313779